MNNLQKKIDNGKNYLVKVFEKNLVFKVKVNENYKKHLKKMKKLKQLMIN
jgi:hypothetical protein